jgi:hypothetical protein
MGVTVVIHEEGHLISCVPVIMKNYLSYQLHTKV